MLIGLLLLLVVVVDAVEVLLVIDVLALLIFERDELGGDSAATAVVVGDTVGIDVVVEFVVVEVELVDAVAPGAADTASNGL
jgi:hypothetical protein